jgi:DNA-binding Lrp family transcriptional regulator
MDRTDKKILNRIQRDFPIQNRPFRALGEELDLSEEEVLERIGKLREQGYIRHLGPIFDPRAIGYVSTLCAAKVPPERVEEVAEIINGYAGVTHNYLRDHNYNIWFTVIAQGREGVRKVIEQIKEKTGIDDILDMPAERFFKLRVEFKLDQ